MTTDHVSRIELMVLLALMRVRREAYGVPIAREIRDIGSDTSIGSVYAALERLERRGYVASILGDPSPGRGGRARKYFEITAKGIREVQDSKRMLTSLWRNLGIPKSELA